MMTDNIVFKSILFVFVLSLMACSSDDDSMTPDTMEEEMEMEMDDNNADNDPGDGDNNDNLDTAPSFVMETTSGDKVESDDYIGKNYVIWFFGAGCPPCRSIGPKVESDIYQAFKDNDNFVMVGGDQWDQNDANVDDFASVTGITFPLGTKASSVAADFGTTYDRFVIVNAEGKIVFKSSNRVSNHIDEAVEIIKGLLE